jgi:hypothetical protein
VPISYSINGALPSGVLYFLTGPKSLGKTALLDELLDEKSSHF